MAANNLLTEKQGKELWEMMGTHPFVVEMARGDLPHDKFRDYITQDKIFCGVFRGFVCSILADLTEAQDFEQMHQQIAQVDGYRRESELFQELFSTMKVGRADVRPHPVTEGFCNFLHRVASSGTLTDKLVVLYAVEGSYMEWAERVGTLTSKDKGMARWIEVHKPQNLGRLVEWIQKKLDQSLSGSALKDHHHHLFKRALQHEIMFFDAAYRPGSSVFPGEFGLSHPRGAEVGK